MKYSIPKVYPVTVMYGSAENVDPKVTTHFHFGSTIKRQEWLMAVFAIRRSRNIKKYEFQQNRHPPVELLALRLAVHFSDYKTICFYAARRRHLWYDRKNISHANTRISNTHTRSLGRKQEVVYRRSESATAELAVSRWTVISRNDTGGNNNNNNNRNNRNNNNNNNGGTSN